MDVDVDLGGLPELETRLAHVHAGLLNLARELAPQLQASIPPMAVAPSPHMRPRTWGAGDVWTLPAGGWVAGRVELPDTFDELIAHVQQLLDGS